MEPLTESDPRQIGPYRLLYRLGAGGMGRVYLGLSRGNRAVAIKVIHPHLAVDRVFVASFRREVDAAKAVGGAYTAPVIASSEAGDPVPWLATAYVEGPSLADAIIERRSALPEFAVWRLAGGLVEALQAVHACGLVHRDLKPANVLLALDGPRVIDFGITQALTDIFTTIGRREPIGTPAYMSPEQAECESVGPASDVFSLGSVIAFAATGKVLFGAPLRLTEMYRVINGQPDLTGIAPPLRGMLAACLEKNPADRPSLDELLDIIMIGDTAFSTVSPSSFWPRELATYIRTRDDVSRDVRDIALVEATPAVANLEPIQTSRSSPARWSYSAAAAIIIIGLTALLAWKLLLATPPSTVSSASYTLRTVHYRDGLVIRTRWTLSGKDGALLTEQVTATEAAGTALAVQLEMPLPVAVLKSLGTATFSLSAPQVIDHGQGLVWPLRIPAHGKDVVYCLVDVGSGAVSGTRLRMLTGQLSPVRQGPVTMAARPVTLQSLTILPKVLRIAPGDSRRPALMGLLSNGKRALGSYLSKLSWKSADPSVATVSAAGTITAVATGETRITVTKGTVTSSISVIVTAQQAAGQSPGSQPGTAPASGSSAPSGPPSSSSSEIPPSNTPPVTTTNPTITPTDGP
jgi:serine/threonine protein kinase